MKCQFSGLSKEIKTAKWKAGQNRSAFKLSINALFIYMRNISEIHVNVFLFFKAGSQKCGIALHTLFYHVA